jgi:hypothetical protein
VECQAYFPDPIWAMGDKSLPCDAFKPERVFPLGADVPEAAAAGAAAGAGAAAAAAAAPQPPVAEVAAMAISSDSGGGGNGGGGDRGGGGNGGGGGGNGGGGGGDGGGGGGGLPAIDVSTPAGMDAMFERCFMAGLREKLTDAAGLYTLNPVDP